MCSDLLLTKSCFEGEVAFSTILSRILLLRFYFLGNSVTSYELVMR